MFSALGEATLKKGVAVLSGTLNLHAVDLGLLKREKTFLKTATTVKTPACH